MGRTGTYISIDVQLQRMRQEGDVNVQQFVMQMRAQRSSMVQTEVCQKLYHASYNLFSKNLAKFQTGSSWDCRMYSFHA